MIIVFLFLGIIVLFTIFSTIILISTVKIKIQNLRIDTSTKPIIDSNLKIKMQFYIFKKIKWFSMTLNKERLKKVEKKVKENKIEQVLEKKLTKDIAKKAIKGLKMHLEELKLEIILGISEDAALTSILVGAFSAILGIVIGNIKEPQNCSFTVAPYYRGDLIKIHLDSIISVKMVHIIYNLYFIMKGRKKKDERTSNRKFNEYSYERH